MAKKSNIFSALAQGFYDANKDGEALEDCYSGSNALLLATPLRYRIIALGFMKHLTVDELNEKLTENGCPALYSRSLWEAVLIYAFHNGFSYNHFKDLSEKLKQLYDGQDEGEWFQDKKITYEELERYVLENSHNSGDLLHTVSRTKYINGALLEIDDDQEAFSKFISSNISSFSQSREKTRYYFCKYLYYYLNTRIKNYFEACRKKQGVDEALSELSALKVVTKLRRNLTMPEDKKMALIKESALSCGELFDSFNYFYFGYVSLDWAEVLLESCDNPSKLKPHLKKALAGRFRTENPSWKSLEDAQVIQAKILALEEAEDEAYSLDGTKGYGKNRAGELTLSKYIKGTLDIDRTVLICFLLFFSFSSDIPNEHKLTVDRLQEILVSCGYTRLDMENDLDWFAAEFIESQHPWDLLNDFITEYAGKQENSFLYRIYNGAVSYREQLENSML